MTQTTETQAALEEGLAPLYEQTAEIQSAYLRRKERAELIASLKAEQQVDNEILSNALESQNLQGFTAGGKVRVRLSDVNTPRLDAKLLKEMLPEVFKRFTVVTKSQRLTVN